MGTPITVSVIYPGYIRSEMNENVRNAPFMVSTEKGVAAIVDAVEKEKASAHVPAWPWVPVGQALKHLPLPLARKLMG
jgi:short-subunit dehydrogenase